MQQVHSISDSLQTSWDQLSHEVQKPENRGLVLVSSIGLGLCSAFAIYQRATSSGRYSSKPSSSQLTGGNIERSKVKSEFQEYSNAYGTKAGEGIKNRHRTTELVDTFYNLVTDIYEWGWGQSFHFSPKLPGKDWHSSEAAHEARLANLLLLEPGQQCLDVGCGVGGPMRTIASTTGAEVTGITINAYQVQRGVHHNTKLELTHLCKPVQGNFLAMPFETGRFDAAYAIEATCHANKLEEVYGEIFRVLKPGGLFASYEWVATDKFDPSNKEHVQIIDEINYGNGLPEMRTWQQAEQSGIAVGFELLRSSDIATASSVAGHWYGRLKWLRDSNLITVNRCLVNVMSTLGLAPRGMKAVHEMLVDVSLSLVRGGETGVFTPMHLLLFKKPLEGAGKAGKHGGKSAREEDTI